MRSILMFLPLLICINCFPQNTDSLNRILETVYKKDQGYRLQIDSVQKRFGARSNELNALWEKITTADSINTLIVANIIDQFGWLGTDKISKLSNKALFLVIQHSKAPVREKYLQVLKKAVENKAARPQDYALMLDRSLMDQGKLQIYGSQLQGGMNGHLQFYPISDEQNVNKRRKEMGLEPIEDYAKRFKIVYTPPTDDTTGNNLVLLNGFIFDKNQAPIKDALILLGDNKTVLGKSKTDGSYSITLDPKYSNWAFIIKHEHFKRQSFIIIDEGKNVNTINIMLEEK